MTDRGTQFRDMHVPGAPFVLANAWDVGSARMLVALGAKAIGTSSAAHAFTLGRPDMGQVTRDEALAHVELLAGAVACPISADLENGFGEAPDTVAETVALASECGAAGLSIEDTALPATHAYDRDLAVERIEAAVARARSLPKDIVVCARADGVLNGAYDMAEAMVRAVAFAEAGADCVYVPMPPSMDDLAKLCAAVACPVNALAAGPYTQYDLRAFAAAGVARISLGSALARVTHQAILDAAGPVLSDGNFGLLRGASGDAIDALLQAGTPD
ncbi:MAG: isocitrate lyase/phosphoenolpyruvate mutase family protein [Devosiaceae bacterium]|nr:isocitrate lyase/phosphoenolpyruvate mutase family protein [Devosiaceae bacterium MH13]